MKRQRGRGRKPGGGHGHGGHGGGHGGQPNRTLESSGPEIKVRGPASHIYERYLQLARDASSSGDRVMAENYLQHAEHYFRLYRAMQPAMPPPQPQSDRFASDLDYEGDEESAEGESEAAEGGEAAAEGADQPNVEFPAGQQQQRQDFEGGDFRRRRGRRNRFRPGGEGGEREGGEAGARDFGDQDRGGDRPERAERPQRAERPEGERPQRAEGERPQRERRPPRENREGGEAPSAEGFSNGPKPAFLGSD